MTANVVIQYYARGNVGTDEASEELVQFAEEIKDCYERKGYRRTKEEYEDFDVEGEFGRGWSIDFDDDAESITISNKMLDKEGGSWGYEEAVISVSEAFERLAEAKKELDSFMNKISDDKVFVIDTLNGKDYAVGVNFEHLEEGDVLTKEEAKEYLQGILEYLENDFEMNGTPEEQSMPVCGNNPYAWDEPGFDWEIKTDSIRFTTHYQSLEGAHYHSYNEELVLRVVDKKDVQLDDDEEEDDE